MTYKVSFDRKIVAYECMMYCQGVMIAFVGLRHLCITGRFHKSKTVDKSLDDVVA